MKIVWLLALMWLLPFGLSYLMSRFQPGDTLIRTTNFFMLFNILLMGLLLVGVRSLMHEHALADNFGWTYSPMFIQYSLCVIALSLPAVPAMFLHAQFKAAVCLSYGLFLFVIGLYHWIQASQGLFSHTQGMSLLIIYDLVTALFLFAFAVALVRHQ